VFCTRKTDLSHPHRSVVVPALTLALTSQIAGIRTSAGFRLFLGAIM
jgi:hypothetical protein